MIFGAPEELDTQVPDKQGSVGFQLFTSLLRFRSGWFANHALASNPAITSRLQSCALVGGSLSYIGALGPTRS